MKIDSGELMELVKELDIFCLQETWLQSSALVAIDGYHCFRSERKAKRSAKRGSGEGACLKHKLQSGLTRLQSDNLDCLWTKLDKYHLKPPNDVFLCNTTWFPETPPISTAITWIF